jgi:type II secretory pathway pseudopilin PulG
MTIWIKLAAVVVVAVLAASVLVAWRDARKEQAALQAELKTTQQALAEATARQASRDAAVNDLVAGLKKKEAAVQKPAQVVAALPDALTLPEPITIEPGRPASPPSSGQAESAPYTGKNASRVPDGIQPRVNFPAADLKPLYDFAVECKACQAKLGVAQANLADEKVKSQALGRERDDALRAAKGGSVLRRIARAAKWFAIGAAAGAIAAKAAHL